MVLEPQISSQKSQFQWPLNEKTPGFFYCPRDIVWFVHLLLRFPIYRITHSESFMVPQMVNVNFIPTSPRPHPYRMSRFLPPHFFVRAVWKNLSFPLSLKMDSLMVHLLWTLIHRGWGGGIRIKMVHPFHRYFTGIIIDNKSNWQEAYLLEELNLAGGGGEVDFCWVCAAGLSEPVPIILVVYSVTKNRPNLSYVWENVIFTIQL